MEKYLNSKSGIEAYETGTNFIRIKYKDETIYLYTDESSGANNIREMKQLAQEGRGLNTYINQNVRNRYAKKEQ